MPKMKIPTPELLERRADIGVEPFDVITDPIQRKLRTALRNIFMLGFIEGARWAQKEPDDQ
jgi:hypothetical protein